MILPSKIIKTSDSLINLASYILPDLRKKERSIDELLSKINELHDKKIETEKLLLCLNFLFLINKIDINYETYQIKLL